MTEVALVPATDDAALEADPVRYMAVVLNRAKGWLDEAQSIEQVRDARAVAVGYESVIREKELAFDAQLSATEIVRRCERRIGELVREGQQNGTVRQRGDTVYRPGQDRAHVPDLGVTEAAGVRSHSDIKPLYVMADTPPERFEQAVAEAREEGNLSRANVVRKVKGEKPKAERSEWHRQTHRIDSNRVLTTLAHDLDAAATGLELMERDGLDPDVVAENLPSIEQSIRTIRKHIRRIT